jgi:amino-acid N-acetyltransferase
MQAGARSQARTSPESYLLTTSAEAFFRKNVYSSAGREEAPAAIKSTREFAAICPASSAFMFKQLVTAP